MEASVGNYRGLCYFVTEGEFMDDFLGMLRKAADKVLGTGHSFGTATDEVVTNQPQNQFYDQEPVNPNVEYTHPAQPKLQSMPALEPVKEVGKPADRIKQAIDAVRRQNEAINQEVAREYRMKSGLTVDGTPDQEPIEGQDGNLKYVKSYKTGGMDI